MLLKALQKDTEKTTSYGLQGDDYGQSSRRSTYGFSTPTLAAGQFSTLTALVSLAQFLCVLRSLKMHRGFVNQGLEGVKKHDET